MNSKYPSGSLGVLLSLQLLVGFAPAVMAVTPNPVNNQSTGTQTNTQTSTQTNLTVDHGSTRVIDFGTQSTLSLTGNLTNSGTIYAISTNPQVTTATLSANNIFNQTGGIITTILPTGGLAGYSFTVPNLNLVLNAVNNIVNAGTISSAGSLAMTAGGSITNALPSHMSGPSPVMSAINNITMNAANIVNSGQILANIGNINAITANLTNNHGLMQALQGNINIQTAGAALNVQNVLGNICARDQIIMSTLGSITGVPSSLCVNGGTLTAHEVLFNNTSGNIGVVADHINGLVHLSGKTGNVAVTNGNLTLGSMNLTGSEVFQASGDLNLSGLFALNPVLSTGGGSFIGLAGGNIIAPSVQAGALINASNPLGTGGSILLSSGVTFAAGGQNCANCAAPGEYHITGNSHSGGSILLSSVSLCTNNNSIVLMAAGDRHESIAIGNICNCTGTTSAFNTNTVFAKAPGNIVLGNVLNANGSITALSTFGNISVRPGSTLQAFNGSVNLATQCGNILLNHVGVTSVGGNVNLRAGADIRVDRSIVQAFSSEHGHKGGNVTLRAGDDIQLFSNNKFAAVGGNIDFTSGGSITSGANNSFQACAGCGGSTGGNIRLHANDSIVLGVRNSLVAEGGDINVHANGCVLAVGPYSTLNAFSEGNHGGNVILHNSGDVYVGSVSKVNATGGNVIIGSSCGDVSTGSNVSVNAFSGKRSHSGNVEVCAENGNVCIGNSNDINAVGGNVLVAAGRSIDVGHGTGINGFSGECSGGNVTLQACGDIKLDSCVEINSVGGNICLDAAHGSIFSAPGNRFATFPNDHGFGGSVYLQAGRTLNLICQRIESARGIYVSSGRGVNLLGDTFVARHGDIGISSGHHSDVNLIAYNNLFAKNDVFIRSSGDVNVGLCEGGDNHICADNGCVTITAPGKIDFTGGNHVQSNHGGVSILACGPVDLGYCNEFVAGGGNLVVRSNFSSVNLGTHNTLNAFEECRRGGSVVVLAHDSICDEGHNSINAVGGGIKFAAGKDIFLGNHTQLAAFSDKRHGLTGISLVAGRDIVLGYNNRLATSGGDIHLLACDDIYVGPGGTLTAWSNHGRGGSICVDARDLIKLDCDVRIQAKGGNIALNSSRFDSERGNQFCTFNPDCAESGRISISAGRELFLNGQVIDAAGSVYLWSRGPITLNRNLIVARNNGSVCVDSERSGIWLVKDNNIYAGRDIHLNAACNIDFGTRHGSSNELCANKGDICLTAGGSIHLAECDRLESNKGGVNLLACENICLGHDDQIAAGGGNVSLVALHGRVELGSHNTVNAFYKLTSPHVGGNVIIAGKRVDLGFHNSVNAVGGRIHIYTACLDRGCDNDLRNIPRNPRPGTCVPSRPDCKPPALACKPIPLPCKPVLRECRPPRLICHKPAPPCKPAAPPCPKPPEVAQCFPPIPPGGGNPPPGGGNPPPGGGNPPPGGGNPPPGGGNPPPGGGNPPPGGGDQPPVTQNPPESQATPVQATVASASTQTQTLQLNLPTIITPNLCTGFFIQDKKESYLQATQGTQLAITGGRELVVRNGSALVKSGEDTLVVQAPSGTVTLKPSTVALFECPGGDQPARITVLDDAGPQGVCVKVNQCEYKLSAGEQMMISAPHTGIAEPMQIRGQVPSNHLKPVALEETTTVRPVQHAMHGTMVTSSDVYVFKAAVNLREEIPKLAFLQCRTCHFRNDLEARYQKLQREAAVAMPRLQTSNKPESLKPTSGSGSGTQLSPLVSQEQLQGQLKPVASTQIMQMLSPLTAVVSQTTDLVKVSANHYQLKQGSLLMKAELPLRIDTPHGTVVAKTGSIFLVSANSNITRVRDVVDSSSKGVSVVMGAYQHDLLPGKEISIVANCQQPLSAILSDDLARRQIKETSVGNLRVVTADFSILDSLMKHPLLKAVRFSSRVEDREIYRQIEKTAAVLSVIVDRQAGPYYVPKVDPNSGLASAPEERFF